MRQVTGGCIENCTCNTRLRRRWKSWKRGKPGRDYACLAMSLVMNMSAIAQEGTVSSWFCRSGLAPGGQAGGVAAGPVPLDAVPFLLAVTLGHLGLLDGFAGDGEGGLDGGVYSRDHALILAGS